MYNKNKRIIAMGRMGFHYTSQAQEVKNDIYEDAHTALDVLFSETCNKLAGLAVDYAKQVVEERMKADKEFEELLSYHTYIALTNPGRSGKASRKWLKKNYQF
jgi:hypothetical protein